jgi:hypothetical protein
MRSLSIQETTETGDAYWRSRVVALEGLIAELLIKNQDMRFALQATEQEVSTTGVPSFGFLSKQNCSSPET